VQTLHVDASPSRTEIMTRETAETVIDAVRRFHIPMLDITGGVPELNPSFRYLVMEARAAGAHVMVRHNLTVMFERNSDSCWKRSYTLRHGDNLGRGHDACRRQCLACSRSE